MVSLAQLWLPVVVSAAAVFIASSVIHMVLKYHNSEYRKLPNEDEVRAALRSSAKEPGQYMIPHVADPKLFKDPAVAQKFVDGPIGIVTLRKPGPPAMGPFLAQWFVLNLVIAVLAGYIASKMVPAGASFLAICRPVSVVTFVAYAGGSVTGAIWMGKPWSAAVKEVFDAFVFGLVTAIVFALLWPTSL